MMTRTCRCGLSYQFDALGLVNHVASAEHAERVAKLPPVHNHSANDWNDHPRVKAGCPACEMIVTAAP